MIPPASYAPALAVAAALVFSACSALAAGPALLTVTGAVESPNRGPMDPETDRLFAFNETDFERARAFDLAALAALPQATVRADFPKGGPEARFTGPLLVDLLAAAGAQGSAVTLQAMDGYAVEASLAELAAKGAVIALARDGAPFDIGGLGPAQLVFPRAEREDLAQMPDDWWIWQIFHVRVE